MSIQSYINSLCNAMLYRLSKLDRFTDQFYINKTAAANLESQGFVLYNEPAEDRVELCDVIHTLKEKRPWITEMLFMCREHEPTRELRKLEF